MPPSALDTGKLNFVFSRQLYFHPSLRYFSATFSFNYDHSAELSKIELRSTSELYIRIIATRRLTMIKARYEAKMKFSSSLKRYKATPTEARHYVEIFEPIIENREKMVPAESNDFLVTRVQRRRDNHTIH